MDEAQVVGGIILKARQNAAVVLEPGKQVLNLPAAAISAQGPSILRGRPGPVAFMRRNHLNAQGRQAPVQRITVIGAVPNQAVGLGDGETPGERGRDQGDFMGRSRGRVDGGGRPWRSATAMSFVPLPRLVAPTSHPFFLPR